MGRKRKKRRQAHGSAWHWKQTDCWYCTLPRERERVALFDGAGERIRGKDGKEVEQVLRMRFLKLAGDMLRGWSEVAATRISIPCCL